MTEATQTILKQALDLKPLERAELIEQLILSFDIPRNQRIETLLAEEIESRINAFEAGNISDDDEEAVWGRLNQRCSCEQDDPIRQ